MSPEDRVPSVSVKTIGCRLNQAESAGIMAAFRAAGYGTVLPGDEADVCVVHTCAVTANAERKCVQFARSIKRRNPETFLVLAGCAVEVSHDRLRRDTGADLLAGQADKSRLPELVAANPNRHFPLPPRPSPPTPLPFFSTTRALVKVQDGCDFNCSYCVVPRARGNPVSRPVPEVLDEVRGLAAEGFKEVVLTGANLGCYRSSGRGIVDLLAAVEQVAGIHRIRLSSIEVSTAEREILDYMSGSEKLCRYLHIPLQSGSSTVLQRMARRYTPDHFRRLVEFAQTRVPRLGLGTDLIVGFPGEEETDFEQTMAIVTELPFSNLHVFPYSKRAQTPAARMPGQVPERTRKERVAQLVELGEHKKQTFAERLIGHPVSVLIEEQLPDGSFAGWTGEYLRARARGPDITTGDLVGLVPSAVVAGILE